MLKKSLISMVALLATFSTASYANNAAIIQSLTKLGVSISDIQPSPLSGVSTVLTDNGVLYVTDDGKQMIQGPLYDISGKTPVNVTFQTLDKKVEALAPQMIVYKAPKEQHVVTVFTDITCGYCHKLHQQISDYNALGITVRYLAFPREGLQGDVAKAMKNIWCAKDRNAAFDAAMAGKTPVAASCNVDIGKQYQLGLLYGIQGTPAILTKNGVMIPGYQGPNELKQYLDRINAG